LLLFCYFSFHKYSRVCNDGKFERFKKIYYESEWEATKECTEKEYETKEIERALRVVKSEEKKEVFKCVSREGRGKGVELGGVALTVIVETAVFFVLATGFILSLLGGGGGCRT
jgi:hypothetical protein